MVLPQKLKIFGKEYNVSMTNFLAVHKKLRGMKLAQIMITEALRRNRANGYNIGFYHSAQSIPTPFLTIRSSNRLINTNKLIDVRYTSLPKGMTRKEFAKKYELPNKDRFKVVGNLRRMEQKDLKEVYRLYTLQCEKHGIYLVFSKAQLAHYLMPKKDIVMTYVVEDAENPGKLSDFMSMTYFHQTVLNGKELGHEYVMETDATLFYYSFQKNDYLTMIKQALWLAKDDMGTDTLVIYTIMDHKSEELNTTLNFLPDNTPFHYYMLNYSFGERVVESHDMADIFP